MGWSCRPDTVAQGCVCRVSGNRLEVQRDAVFVGGRCAVTLGWGVSKVLMLPKHLYVPGTGSPLHPKAEVASETLRKLR